MSDSDDELRYPGSVKDMEVKEKDPPPSDVTGLALTEHFFGPSLSPVAATPAQWTQHRRGSNTKYNNVFDHRRRSISDTVAVIEKELTLDNDTLQKCISILRRLIEWDDVEVSGVCPPTRTDTI